MKVEVCMQVNSINSVSFKGSPFEERFANLSDKDLKEIAYNKASKQTNDKKHRRIDNAIFYSLPLAAGAATLADKIAVQGIKADRIRGFKALKALGTTASWGATLAGFSAVWGAKNLVEKHSKTARDFSEKHPLISTIGTFVGGIAAMVGINNGFAKLAEKQAAKGFSYGSLKILAKAKNVLNNSKVLNKAVEILAKTPSSIKTAGKGALAFAPVIFIATSLIHQINHDSVKAKQFAKNYNDLKIAQEMIRQDLIKEAVEEEVY